MKKLISIQFTFFLLLFGNVVDFDSQKYIVAKQGAPSYAKWGRIAMKKTKEKYPQAEIIDYFHIGREKETDYSIEKFKLWLKDDCKEFGVFVNIKFDKKEHIVEINYIETLE